MSLEAVWFKRDLRVHDHAPLFEAAATGRPVVCLYILEPSLWARPEYSGRQLAFLHETLEDLDAALRMRGARLTLRVGEAVDVFAALHAQHGLSCIRAHQETGLIQTWERDKAVAAWARSCGVAFHEQPQHGIIRGLKTRNGWAKKWDAFMSRTPMPAPQTVRCASLASDDQPGEAGLGLAHDPCPGRQSGGRAAAIEDLAGFLGRRGRHYRREMSSPVTAYDACSRLSAHLALGALSMREVYQAALRARAQKRDEDDRAFIASIDSFIARLHWHCHFMQKFEDEPEIERRDLHPAYRGARPRPEPETLRRWIEGETGFPFLDACMRALKATGWLNFRMRAMAAAFSSYHLWADWRHPAEALAARFTDFEPGIHYAQFQMQSGTTGVNTPRIYNPVKQGHDQDPDGVFVRRWAPELARLPGAFLHEPWKAPAEVLDAAGVALGRNYPERLVEHEQAAREARARIGALRKGEDHRAAAAAIQHRHGSRKSGLKQTGSARAQRRSRRTDPAQGAFDFGGR